MSKGMELKLHQREHFESKIDKLLEPEIEREELKLKTTINKILDKGVDKFGKSIGADKVIARLGKAEEKWAEKQAEQFAETTPQGQRLAFLKALQNSAKDKVKEASVSDELKATLDNLFKMVGVSWERKLPALPRK